MHFVSALDLPDIAFGLLDHSVNLLFVLHRPRSCRLRTASRLIEVASLQLKLNNGLVRDLLALNVEVQRVQEEIDRCRRKLQRNFTRVAVNFPQSLEAESPLTRFAVSIEIPVVDRERLAAIRIIDQAAEQPVDNPCVTGFVDINAARSIDQSQQRNKRARNRFSNYIVTKPALVNDDSEQLHAQTERIVSLPVAFALQPVIAHQYQRLRVEQDTLPISKRRIPMRLGHLFLPSRFGYRDAS